jgi:hypothetical protein
MATANPKQRRRAAVKSPQPQPRQPSGKSKTPSTPVLYLYAISQMPEREAPAIPAEAIDGVSTMEAIRCEEYLCWISRVARDDFADHLSERMQDLEWLASAGLRHQRVVSEICSVLPSLPARFGTVFLSDDSLSQHVKQRRRALRDAFQRVADADEWGIKIFALAKPKIAVASGALTGSDYLKRKAQVLRPAAGKKLDEEVQKFVSELTKLAVETSPGGKASTGQPGLVWHGSFLVRRKDVSRFRSALEKYAEKWDGVRRIDGSGPWPPYSFVGEHVQ